MFDVIDFLESVGQDAQWRHAESEALSTALAEVGAEPALPSAILARNEKRLAEILGTGTFCCYINPAKENENDGDEKGGDEKDKDKDGSQPAKKDIEKR